jgi:hypothetical protein
MVEAYTGVRIKPCGGIQEHNGEKCPVDGIDIGGGDNNGNGEKISEELKKICTEENRDYGLVGYDGGICDQFKSEKKSGFDELLGLIQRALN